MTIKELLDKVNALRVNSYTKDEMITWINRVERRIWYKLVETHARPVGLPVAFSAYDSETDESTVLLAPPEHDEVYEHYLISQIALYNMEQDHYNNAALMYNAAWDELAAWWNRTYMPVQRVTHFA
jgi:hypothetical protein